MNQGLVTVVIPVYNVEQQLDRCVNSVVNQTYQNLEIILVDDGSPDRCPEMCEQWARKDPRIRVIHKENAGLGMARNTGIDNAHGAYICFFDSDDYVALDTVEKVYACATRNSGEIVLFGFCDVGVDGKTKRKIVPKTEKTYYEGIEIQEYILPNLIAPDPMTGKKTNLWMSAWACMYSMALIRRTGWKFVSERQYISEDVYSHLFLYREVKSVGIFSEALYFHCENRGSLTHIYRKDRYEKNKYFYDACQKACIALEYNLDVKNRLNFQYISNIIGVFKLIVTADLSVKEQKRYLSEIITDQHFQTIVNKIDIRKESLPRRILLEAIRHKRCKIVYKLVKLKT